MLPDNRQPTHPGKILLDHFLKPMNLSQVGFAKHLGKNWTPAKLNEIINEKRGVTVQTALDFADALDTTPQFWLNLQVNYNLWDALQEHEKVQSIQAAS
jgi:addiction module HigA family antidote